MTTYSISLDDVDLALLPMRMRTNTNDFLKKEHYQFQLVKEEICEEPTSTSSTTKYKCHICAIDVPAAFAREHGASVKHRANARIASVAARRMRGLVAAVHPPVVRQPQGRFCTHCVSIVDGDHEKTKEHRVAVMHDNLLWELTKAYVGHDDDDDTGHIDDKEIKNVYSDCKNSNLDRVTDSNMTVQRFEKADSKIQDGEIAASSSTHDKKLENLKDKDTNKEVPVQTKINGNAPNDNVHSTSRWIKAPVDKEENRTTQNGPANKEGSKHTKEDYEKELQKFMDTDNKFEIKESYNRIQLKMNDITMNVYSDHFHSYHRMYNNGMIECILCDCTFNNKDAEAHKYDLNHMAGVARIGKNSDFIREINDTYSHCTLCNQKIKNENVSSHKQSQYHVTRKTNNTKANRTKTETAGREKNKTQQDREENKEMKGNMAANDGTQNEDPYKEIRGVLWCMVCDCQVPRDLNNRKDHVKGLRHVNNMK